MVSITIQDINARTALDLVNELKSSGFVINIDFEWEFHPEQWVNIENVRKKHCVFKFKDPKYATFYSLKWQII